MEDNERFILANLGSILSHRRVKAETIAHGGVWELNTIHYIHGTPKNVEFGLVLWNGETCIRVKGKIHRESAQLSVAEVGQI